MASSRVVQDLIDSGATPPQPRTREWDQLVTAIETERGRRICGGRRLRNRLTPQYTGWPCEAHPRAGRTRCGKHGGATVPPGPEHHLIKHGRYSKALKGTSLEELYAVARRDPDLLALDDEIALLSSRLRETMAKLARGDSQRFWRTAYNKVVAARRHFNSDDQAGGDRTLAELEDIFDRALGDYAVWDEWFEGVETLRKLVDTERKYREGLNINLPIERGMLMLTVLASAIKNVLSPESALQLRAEIARLRSGSPATHLGWWRSSPIAKAHRAYAREHGHSDLSEYADASWRESDPGPERGAPGAERESA